MYCRIYRKRISKYFYFYLGMPFLWFIFKNIIFSLDHTVEKTLLFYYIFYTFLLHFFYTVFYLQQSRSSVGVYRSQMSDYF